MSEKPVKNKGGRPKANIKHKDVEKLASYGCTLNEIADYFSVDVNTIRRRFKKDVTKGKVGVKIRLRKAQLATAIEDKNPTMQIWLGKNMLNQSDTGTFEEDELLDDVEFELDEGEQNE